MALAKVVIKGENQLTGAVNGAKQDMGALEKASQKMGETLKKAFAFTAIIATVKKLGDTCSECFAEFSQANRSYKQLAMTMKDQSAYTSLIGTIGKLSTQTLESKAGIESMVAELAALGKSAEDIENVSSAAVYLSNVTGKSLQESMNQLLQSTTGEVGELKKYGLGVENLTKAELQRGAAIDIVIDKYKNLSQSMAEADTQQHKTNILNTLGDIRQQIGGIVDYNVGPIFANIDRGLKDSYDNITSVINYIGAVIKNFPEVAGRSLALVGEMVKKILSWNFISGLIETTVNNIITVVKGLFELIPKVLPDTLSFLFTSAVASVERLGAFVLKTFESVISGIVNALANTGLGEFLGIKKIDINLGSAKLGAKADATQEQANTYAAAIGGRIDEIVATVKNTSGEVSDRTKSFFTEQFGEILDGYTDDINTIVAPSLKEIEVAADVTKQTIGGLADAVEDIDGELKSGNFLERAKNKLTGLISSLTGKDEETSGTILEKGLGYFTSSLGEAGNVISELTTNMMTFGPAVGAILTAIKYVFEGFGEVISGVLNDFIKYGIEPIKEIGRVIGQLLKPVFETLMPLVRDVADFLISILDSLGTALLPIIQTINMILAPVLQVISSILKALMPVFKVFAKVVVTITGTIQYVVQVLQHWVATIMNWLAGLNILGWKPFKGLAMNDPGAPGKYGEYIKNKWGEVDSAFNTADATGSTATQTAVATAGYQGATHVTINIYQEAPVVGDGGMRQFAAMLKDEFDNMNYYGVTA